MKISLDKRQSIHTILIDVKGKNMGWYSKRHYKLLANGSPDTPFTIKCRQCDRQAWEEADKETAKKFVELTVRNAREYCDYRAKRANEIYEILMKSKANKAEG